MARPVDDRWWRESDWLTTTSPAGYPPEKLTWTNWRPGDETLSGNGAVLRRIGAVMHIPKCLSQHTGYRPGRRRSNGPCERNLPLSCYLAPVQVSRTLLEFRPRTWHCNNLAHFRFRLRPLTWITS